MKINNIDLVCSSLMNVVNFSFRDPGAINPYIAKSIVGLDADEIVPKFYGRSQSSDDNYYSLTLDERDVIIQVKLNPDFSIGKTPSDLRDDLYRTIASSRSGAVRLRFKNGNDVVAYVKGFISKVESPHFEESLQVQITIKCDDPMLRSEVPIDVDLANYDGTSLGVYNHLSTAPCGFKMEVTFNHPTESYVVQDLPDPNWSFVITPVGEFLTGDKLYFSSELNDKYVYMVRSTVITHLIDKIEPNAIWPLIFPGYNVLFNTDGVDLNALSYFPTYWGV